MSGTGVERSDRQPPAKPRSRTRLAVQVVVSLVVAIFYCLFKGIDLAQVWTDIWAMTWLELTTLALIGVWNLATYALAFDPRGTPHGFQNIGDTPRPVSGDLYALGVEQFFEQYAELLPGPVDPAVLAALLHTSWAEFAGPPLAVSDPL